MIYNARDYDDCYRAMSPAQEHIRERLAKKYGRKIEKLGDLNALASELFAAMSDADRAADRRKCAATLGRIKSDAKSAAARENGKKGGRPRRDKK